ncbi:MAG: hypothetical protein EBU79_10500, partial [Betaproteobacteria bacterium]|nr:hypothetical protein [Betaproteobacteria bacterium]NCW81364.1 hypothetical protein [Betaproteobacteria bacterium]
MRDANHGRYAVKFSAAPFARGKRPFAPGLCSVRPIRSQWGVVAWESLGIDLAASRLGHAAVLPFAITISPSST